jgi:succinylglutamate desuccinylase
MVKVAQAYEVARLNNKPKGYSPMVMARQLAAMSFTYELASVNPMTVVP